MGRRGRKLTHGHHLHVGLLLLPLLLPLLPLPLAVLLRLGRRPRDDLLPGVLLPVGGGVEGVLVGCWGGVGDLGLAPARKSHLQGALLAGQAHGAVDGALGCGGGLLVGVADEGWV